MMKSDRKAAFQLSLGFIITVVFAVVLLSLALVWLRGTIVGITDLTEQLQQQAGVELDKVFQETTVNFAIWPPDGSPFDVITGTKLSVVAGIKNVAMDSAPHKFGVKIEYKSGPEDASSWIKSTSDNSKNIIFSSNAKFPLIIEVPEGAAQGTYNFRITSCTNYQGVSGETLSGCPLDSSDVIYKGLTDAGVTPKMWGGSPKDFILSVEA